MPGARRGPALALGIERCLGTGTNEILAVNAMSAVPRLHSVIHVSEFPVLRNQGIRIDLQRRAASWGAVLALSGGFATMFPVSSHSAETGSPTLGDVSRLFAFPSQTSRCGDPAAEWVGLF